MICLIRIIFRMNIQHVLFVCFLSALCGGDSGLVSARLNLYTGAVGGSGTINCPLRLSGSNKFFCKEECKAEDILIRTDGVTAHSGRYSIKYRNDSSERGTLSVTITDLTKSDSGRYRCGLGQTLVPDSYIDFEIRVSDAPLGRNSSFIRTLAEGENITYGCSNTVYRKKKFLCKGDCKTEEDILIETEENRAQNGRYSIEYKEGSLYELYMTITQATKSDTGWYKCGYGRALSPDSSYKLPILVIDASTPTPTATPASAATQLSNVLLYVIVTAVIIVIILGLVLTIICIQRNTKLDCWKTRGNSDGKNLEMAIYENCPPVSTGADYQSLDPAIRNQDQTYSTLKHTQHT
ncbi:polymeric immunoglobulin receptor-like isoform X2 [Dicentrarchus labrax]|uniref:polymeric immunoglobulin receptor-like isoform X2 n=1 Tax=Dicentrarchus labrax TaxID=13489 RepID=UPI0021F50C2E|nr:polymeric immunoglobulin receptor-like isoform X2 [Dicentrarchus labrax]